MICLSIRENIVVEIRIRLTRVTSNFDLEFMNDMAMILISLGHKQLKD